ncbi:hypothetical protein G6F57_007202 [Rhizopus arrhizus]|uniref:Methyltransferase domain-containing protein n=1 Tax=Rhizopus oryzae TaxID=64495 RepID=A0A9P6X7L6_RHIOR|nr:hypothetical protein G6F23_003108 [Rhizopus arrhizus]KAG1421400.1 hypothetical protein G6F58_003760 [Rhizopus delemar]KAG0762272.1 hypothetical protein G6F24_006917 [Rhizopus arrhizus]KAG0789376.1 hypothetical protein G6F21_006553 [Rhizopus arrhizus]KAG0810603.1 hypothetical protein G6F20_007824 [Rhizopus arrhizus]
MGNRVSAAAARKKRLSEKNNEKINDKSSEIQTSSTSNFDRRSSEVSTVTYWLPNHNDELDRLSSQHFALKILYDGNISSQIASKLNMDNAVVLDVGCGPGTWLMDVATEFPGGDFHGVDVYNIFPRNIRPANVHFQSCDALEGLPFPDNTFDLVNMRMLYVALKKDEWSLMFKEIYRVLKPGGFLQSCECTTIETGNEFVEQTANAFRQSMRDRDQDPYISPKLGDILRKLNYKILDYEPKVISFAQTDVLTKEFLWNMVQICRNAQPMLEEQFGYTGDQYAHFLTTFEAELQKKPEATWSFHRHSAQK